VTPLAVLAAHVPVPPERAGEAQRRLGVVLLEGPGERLAQVLLRGGELRQRHVASGGRHLGDTALGEVEEVRGVAPLQLLALVALLARAGVIANALQHGEARLRVLRRTGAELQQALVDQRLQTPEGVELVGAGGEADGRGGARREGAAEDAQAAQRGALGGGEQLVAPVERRAQRAVAIGKVGGARGEHAETVVEPLQHGGRRQHAYARGGELDR